MPQGAKRWVWLWAMTWAVPTWAGAPLGERVDSVVNAKGFERAHWGLMVVEAETGKTVFERDADRMFSPASVTKLFTAASALIDLGPDFRFKTPVVRRGEIKDGKLAGDLILVAKGDLSLGGRTEANGTLLFEDNDHTYSGGNPDASIVQGDPLAGLTHLAREVQARGIKAIAGEVLIDDRLFELAPSSGSGPSRVSPILVNDNVVDLLVTPGAKSGDAAPVRIVPETAFISIDAKIDTIAQGQAAVEVRPVGPRRVSIRGSIPVGHKPVLRIHEIAEPAAFARSLFIDALRNRGIRVEASNLGTNPESSLPSRAEVAALPVVAEYTSPPLREYLKVILKVSQNLHASTLPLLIASHHGESTLERGLRREGEILAGLGLDLKSISFGGGAGGSRADLVTPRATVMLLRAMMARPDFPAYDAALPVLGRDGTLVKAVAPESPARGHVRAKTGTYWVDDGLNGRAVLTSKALAGYLETASGRKLAFAFFLNNVPIDDIGGTIPEASANAGRLLGKLCEIFYADDPGPTEPTPDAEPAKADR
ncbi:D-alanyl-D-alanine carboxypeptidase/D-alanyl-D-alanine endopeptidase [Tundrisphaera lichenicola]|uniref:D-alanyl-D-alanine carboxypeptidase/D-alanyl-D-alanine endopeptidase n=1 Tax=Tundrisphaera lichenicola TaxID=2029860 RepID=UPI003EB744C4